MCNKLEICIKIISEITAVFVPLMRLKVMRFGQLTCCASECYTLMCEL